VLVSGCFDLLHSGHVEFFEQAAAYGELYVRLGTDANVKSLKGNETMYNDAERLFMVQNLKCVHDAALSIGTGRFDFESDMKLLKPDIYVVNDDASGMEERIRICSRLGIEMVVPPRKPKSGLAERSSTDMKARIRELVLTQEENPHKTLQEAMMDEVPDPFQNDNRAFDQVVPWRLCFAGGWMDLKWCNELYPGSAITLNIKFNQGDNTLPCMVITNSLM